MGLVLQVLIEVGHDAVEVVGYQLNVHQQTLGYLHRVLFGCTFQHDKLAVSEGVFRNGTGVVYEDLLVEQPADLCLVWATICQHVLKRVKWATGIGVEEGIEGG